MRLTGYGRREWLTSSIVGAAAVAAPAWAGWWWASAGAVAVWLAVLWFFRDPRRRPPPGLEAGALLSPADGRVTAVEAVAHHAAAGGPALVVRIFLSVLDVHVNRSPAGGRVVSVEHRPGRYHDARSPLSAAENESNLVTLLLDDGRTVGVRQIAGRIARRIVCAVAPGDRLERGQRYGMIKFGSGVELILPRRDGAQVLVRPGDRVAAGRTVLARA